MRRIKIARNARRRRARQTPAQRTDAKAKAAAAARKRYHNRTPDQVAQDRFKRRQRDWPSKKYYAAQFKRLNPYWSKYVLSNLPV
jgi:hypothetical protein